MPNNRLYTNQPEPLDTNCAHFYAIKAIHTTGSFFSTAIKDFYLLLIVSLFMLTSIQIATADSIIITTPSNVDIFKSENLFIAGSKTAPASVNDIDNWLSQQNKIDSVNLLGGAYWLYADVTNQTNIHNWVINPNGTVIEKVSIYIFNETEHTLQTLETGYRAQHDYKLHYGKNVTLSPDTRNKILIYFESPYYASPPKFELTEKKLYQEQILFEDVLMLAAFGALLTLTLYNFFIFIIARDTVYFYYSAYLFTYFLGWAFTFHLPADLLDIKILNLHYIPFFLLPVLNTLFYLRFLKLDKYFPRLAKVSRINIILPLILLPSCFFALPYAHTLATIAITIWLAIALTAGIASLRSGYRPARYFVLAFITLIIPGLFILPANIGLIPDLLYNSELVTLLGGTLDAILLAFALADKIKLLSIQNADVVKRLHKSLEVARTDHLTKINNRHAFDQDLDQLTEVDKIDTLSPLILFLIDLDGLKAINDHYGHAKGDELLCYFAADLAKLENDDISCYRIGGDEFTILAKKYNEKDLSTAMLLLEQRLQAHGFNEAGVSFGIAYASECENREEMFTLADQRMYASKTARRRARAQDNTTTVITSN